jgi:oxalate decarboxylase/phosphoglucose isomerase-like protein (cupin superfamily)
MRFSTMAVVLGSGVVVLSLAAIRPVVSAAEQSVAAPRTALILDAKQGERRIRRVMGGALAIIKVDRRNGGSPDLMMGYEEIPPGQMIQAHHHPSMDEIIFVHRGTGTAELGNKTAEVGAGATVFIPQATRVMLRNTGKEPLAIAYFFSGPGYEEYLRETSVPEGQSAPPLSPRELAGIRERHKAHIVFDPQ